MYRILALINLLKKKKEKKESFIAIKGPVCVGFWKWWFTEKKCFSQFWLNLFRRWNLSRNTDYKLQATLFPSSFWSCLLVKLKSVGTDLHIIAKGFSMLLNHWKFLQCSGVQCSAVQWCINVTQHIERYQLSEVWVLSYGDSKSKYLKI